jgi:hypothetical protein
MCRHRLHSGRKWNVSAAQADPGHAGRRLYRFNDFVFDSNDKKKIAVTIGIALVIDGDFSAGIGPVLAAGQRRGGQSQAQAQDKPERHQVNSEPFTAK